MGKFVAVVKASGAGFVFYMWPKPGSADPVQKVSYVKGFAPWGWVIGSGVYIDTVAATFWSRATYFAAGTIALAALLTGFGIAIAIAIAIARSISRPLIEAVKLAQTVAAGDLTMGEITCASAEQENGIEQINKAIGERWTPSPSKTPRWSRRRRPPPKRCRIRPAAWRRWSASSRSTTNIWIGRS